jgi:hypothetical protein
VLPLGWVEIRTLVGTGYGRDMNGTTLHTCPNCNVGLRVSILHPTGAETPLLCGMDGVAPDFGKLYDSSMTRAAVDTRRVSE